MGKRTMGEDQQGGYALGLGLPVIWSVRKDDAKNVHFEYCPV